MSGREARSGRQSGFASSLPRPDALSLTWSQPMNVARPFGRNGAQPHPMGAQQSGSSIEEIIRTAKARIATIDAQMTAYRDMTEERASLMSIISTAEAKLPPPVAVDPPPPPAPPTDPGKVVVGPSKRPG